MFTRDLFYCCLLSLLFFTPKNATFVQSETMASIGVFTRLASVYRYKSYGQRTLPVTLNTILKTRKHYYSFTVKTTCFKYTDTGIKPNRRIWWQNRNFYYYTSKNPNDSGRDFTLIEGSDKYPLVCLKRDEYAAQL